MHPMRKFRLSRPPPAGNVTPSKETGVRFLRGLWQWWLRRRALARTRRELNELSDHLLKDLGLRRGAIDSLFR